MMTLVRTPSRTPAQWAEQPTSSQSHVTWAVYLPLTQSDNTMQTNNIYTDWQLQGTTRCKQESFFLIYMFEFPD